MRTFNQELAKQDVIEILDSQTVLIMMDWAMKIMPLYFREAMTEFFGKRGRSWHVSAVIQREHGKNTVECFVHVFDTCTQNRIAVIAILEHVLSTLKEEKPYVNKAYLKSDNASCYRSSMNLLTMKAISVRTGIAVQAYDYTEAQSGKGICDRKIASMKQHIRRYVNEKHNVVTAEDVKKALESHGGVKGCRIAVAKVDTEGVDDMKRNGLESVF